MNDGLTPLNLKLGRPMKVYFLSIVFIIVCPLMASASTEYFRVTSCHLLLDQKILSDRTARKENKKLLDLLIAAKSNTENGTGSISKFAKLVNKNRHEPLDPIVIAKYLSHKNLKGTSCNTMTYETELAFLQTAPVAEVEKSYTSYKEDIPDIELEEKILKLVPELQGFICENWTTRFLYPLPYKSFDNRLQYSKPCDDLILTTRNCYGASRDFKTILEKSLPDYQFEIVNTTNYWSLTGGNGYYHTFIRIKDFYKIGKHLFIDPTFTQHYATAQNIDYISNFPKVFVGSIEDLQDVFEYYEVPHPEYYMDVREH